MGLNTTNCIKNIKELRNLFLLYKLYYLYTMCEYNIRPIIYHSIRRQTRKSIQNYLSLSTGLCFCLKNGHCFREYAGQFSKILLSFFSASPVSFGGIHLCYETYLLIGLPCNLNEWFSADVIFPLKQKKLPKIDGHCLK